MNIVEPEQSLRQPCAPLVRGDDRHTEFGIAALEVGAARDAADAPLAQPLQRVDDDNGRAARGALKRELE